MTDQALMEKTTNPMTELAARCEAATGPDRALDYDIAHFVTRSHMATGNAPHYTASIDAAMALVDKRALYAFGDMEEGVFGRLCWPQPDGGYGGGYHEANAATVPLAICAAALRARAA